MWLNLCHTVCSFPLSLLQNGQTPLMVAAEQGNLEITQELIRRGANVNLDDVVGLQMCTHYLSNAHLAQVHVFSHTGEKQCAHYLTKKTLTFHLAELTTLWLTPQLL